jgi:hypothetical protein
VPTAAGPTGARPPQQGRPRRDRMRRGALAACRRLDLRWAGAQCVAAEAAPRGRAVVAQLEGWPCWGTHPVRWHFDVDTLAASAPAVHATVPAPSVRPERAPSPSPACASKAETSPPRHRLPDREERPVWRPATLPHRVAATGRPPSLSTSPRRDRTESARLAHQFAARWCAPSGESHLGVHVELEEGWTVAWDGAGSSEDDLAAAAVSAPLPDRSTVSALPPHGPTGGTGCVVGCGPHGPRHRHRAVPALAGRGPAAR